MPDNPKLDAADRKVSEACANLVAYNTSRDVREGLGKVATATSQLALALSEVIAVVDVLWPQPGEPGHVPAWAQSYVDGLVRPENRPPLPNAPTGDTRVQPMHVVLRMSRGPELLQYAKRRDIDVDDAVVELVNAALIIAGGAPLDTGRHEAGGVEELARIKAAYAVYEDALRAHQHGGVAAAEFIDTVYAVFNPQGYEPPEPMVVAGAVDDAAPVVAEPAEAEWGMGSVVDVPVPAVEGDAAVAGAAHQREVWEAGKNPLLPGVVAYWPPGDLGDDPDGDTAEQT